MIQKFKHRRLKQLFETGISSGVNPQHTLRLRKILALLETAQNLEDMDLPGLGLHPLKGSRKGTWAVKVTGNWRITFKIQNGDAFDVDYEDYHWGGKMQMYNPPHPGEIIREFCVEPLNLSVTEAARALGVTRKTFSALLNGRSGISPEMALRLSRVFGRTPEGWLRLQLQYDLWKTRQSVDVEDLKPIEAA